LNHDSLFLDFFVGQTAPVSSRDFSMPVWWTVNHDIMLLKSCIIHGVTQWKKIISEPLVGSPSADFEMPPKIHGI
jgi:hypothetical protein